VRELLRDQRARGARSARALRVLGGPQPRVVASDAMRRVLPTLRLAWRHAAAGERRWVAAAAPLLLPAALAYALGALRWERTAAAGEPRLTTPLRLHPLRRRRETRSDLHATT
jgi:hypothetical protein